MNSKLRNDTFLRALLRQSTDRTPVWMMRQAGRYLPEYRAVREKAGDFMSLCKNPELACEVTLQPLARFALDAAILFSDILTIPDAMGLGLYFASGEGPKFERPLRTVKSIEQLGIPDPSDELRYVGDAVKLIQSALDDSVPLIGFSGSPWTLACYMIEGEGSRDFKRAKALMFREPQAMHSLLTKLSDAIVLYLNAQIASGVDAVMIFDTWGGLLTTRDYRTFSLDYMQSIIKRLDKGPTGETIPSIVFTKNGGQWLDAIADSGSDAVGLDWTVELSRARTLIGDRVAIQGNMDPAILLSTPDRVTSEVGDILSAYGHGSGHIFNLGHGITPDVPIENVQAFIAAVHELSPQYHR